MSDPLRVAILGFGWVTRNFHIPMIAAVPGLSVEVLGTARIEAVKGEKPRARVASLEEAATAPDVDVVVVATAASSAQPQARPAARGDQSQFYVQLERAIRGKGAYPVTHDEALAVMSILEAGIRSAAEQRAIVPEGIH
jgi:predicted dehydrogenase